MNTRQKHTVRRLTLEWNSAGRQQDAPTRQAQLAVWCRERLPAILDRCLGEWSEPELLCQIDRLEIDLDGLNEALPEAEWSQKVEQQLEQALRKALQQEKPNAKTTPQSAADLLVFFLENGRLPWWADVPDNEVVRNALRELVTNPEAQPVSARNALLRVLAASPAQQRLLRQATDDESLALVQRLANPVLAQAVASFLSTLRAGIPAWPTVRRRFWPAVWQVATAGRSAPDAPVEWLQIQLRAAIPEARALDIFLAGSASDATTGELRQNAGAGASTPETLPSAGKQALSETEVSMPDDPAIPGNDTPAPSEQALSETEVSMPDEPAITGKDRPAPGKQALSETEVSMPDDPAIPGKDTPAPSEQAFSETATAPTETDSSQQAHSKAAPGLPAEPANAEKNTPSLSEQVLSETPTPLPGKPVSADALHRQGKSTAGQPSAPPAQAPSPIAGTKMSHRDFDESDRLYLQNAGLVLLAPYLPLLWERLGWVREKEFAGPAERLLAVQLCQFLCDGQDDPPEYQLVLPKILCGLPPDALYDPERSPSPAEFAEGGSLLEAVLKHAPGLGLKSADGLRGSFLLRKGVLRSGGNHWLLHVEKETYDIVLQQVPWNFQIVKYPWMEVPIMVDWVS